VIDEDVVVPKVRRVGPHHFEQKNLRGKPVGQRLKYKWKKRPYVHQVKAVRKLLSTGFGGALLMEPRTGKTKVAIDYASIMHLAGKVSRVLVICPTGVMGIWEEQLADNCPVNYTVTMWDKKGRKNEDLPRYGKDRLDFVIMNYDALATPPAYKRNRDGTLWRDARGKPKRMKKSGGRFEMKKQLKRWQPDMMILDESHRIKSPSAKKTFAIIAVGKDVKYKVIMTGTVVTKKKRMFDVYAQWKFLNPDRFGGWTFSDFKNYYGRYKPIPGQSWSKFLGTQNEDHLHRLIHADSFSIRRDECYDLPKRTPQIIHVELEESAEMYDAMAEDMVARIHTGEITEATIPLVQSMRLRQITSGLAKTSPSKEYPEGRLVVIGSEKLRVFSDRVEDLMEADEKIVVGAHWRGDLARIEALAKKKKYPIFVVKGGVKRHDRDYARKEFTRISGGAIFLGQPSAASEGIDLSAASIMLWYSLTNSWVHWSQFEDRIALSERPTFYEYLLCPGVDELQYETLLGDDDIGKKMITSPERLLRERGY
jgi:SNF2 family DNA or RNA helicase